MSTRNITEGRVKKERTFSLEKIATAIHCQNMISSLRNKYIDPLIIRKKNQPPKKIKKNQIKNFYSLKKKLTNNIFEIQMQDNEKEKGIQTRKEILPIIPNKNLEINRLNKINDKLLATSGMFKKNGFFKETSNKMKLGSMLNIRSSNDNIMKKYYQEIDNISKINEKYNLQLNFRHLDKRKSPEKVNEMNKKFLKNYLFQKYVTSSSIGTNDINIFNDKHETQRAQTISRIHSSQSKESKNSNKEELNKTNTLNDSINSLNKSISEIFKNDDFNEDKNTFITKLKTEANKDKEKIKVINRYNSEIKRKKNNIRLNIYENNKSIINHDQKVSIDLIYSNSLCKIEPNQLLYDSINKTNYEAQNQPSYRRIKKFEKIIDKIIKSSQIYTLTINK
jgi:hypothetical protein